MNLDSRLEAADLLFIIMWVLNVESVDRQERVGYIRWMECRKRPRKKDDSKEWTASIPSRVNSDGV